MSETTEVLDKVGEMGSALAAKFEIVFGELAEKMGQGAEYFWPIFVKQQVVEAVSSLAIITSLTLVLAGLLTAITKLIPKTHEERGEWQPISTAVIICSILSIVTIIAIGFNCSNYEMIATGLINPEYAAIKDAVEMVGDL